MRSRYFGDLVSVIDVCCDVVLGRVDRVSYSLTVGEDGVSLCPFSKCRIDSVIEVVNVASLTNDLRAFIDGKAACNVIYATNDLRVILYGQCIVAGRDLYSVLRACVDGIAISILVDRCDQCAVNYGLTCQGHLGFTRIQVDACGYGRICDRHICAGIAACHKDAIRSAMDGGVSDIQRMVAVVVIDTVSAAIDGRILDDICTAFALLCMESDVVG